MALVVRVFNDTEFKPEDIFLTLIEITDATAENLYNVIVNFFKENQINYKTQMIGFAADGANNMFGNFNSVKSRFQQQIPTLFSMKCICHSFNLVASHACESLPDKVEKGMRNIYNYVHDSPKRTFELTAFQELWNLKPNKLVHPSTTRWISIIECVKRVLKNFQALKMFFKVEETFNKVSSAMQIVEWFENPLNKLYLEFLEFALPLFTNLNLEMQSEKTKIHIIYQRISLAFKTILSNFIRAKYLEGTLWQNLDFEKDEYHLPLDEVYFGGHLIASLSGIDISLQKLVEFKTHCKNFYIRSAKEIKKRFPFDSFQMQSLKKMDIINPEFFETSPSIIPLVINFPEAVHKNEFNEIDNEFRIMRQIKNIDKSDILQFYNKVCNIKKGDESLMFPVLKKFLIYIFSLPHSSATVERIFSIINLNKNKLRNRLTTTTLEGILHAKSFIKVSDSSNINFNSRHFELCNQSSYDHKSK